MDDMRPRLIVEKCNDGSGAIGRLVEIQTFEEVEPGTVAVTTQDEIAGTISLGLLADQP